MPLFLPSATGADKLAALLQFAVGHKPVSKLMHWASHARMGGLTPKLLRWYAQRYQINLDEAEESDLAHYACLNELFTRRLKPQARPITDSLVASPVDGTVTALGRIEQGQLLQVKEHSYGLEALFGGARKFTPLFQNAAYCTIYLSPADYHRVHAPVSGRPNDMIYVPGRLFSVNARTARSIPGLFTRNERVISLFKTELGPMAVIMVGAIFVGSIALDWEGTVAPGTSGKPQTWQTPDNTPTYAKGQEIGSFNLGSTVILLFASNKVQWLPTLVPGTRVRMGEALAG